MNKLETIELKAFLPAKDFALCKQFYVDAGFTLSWSSEVMAQLHAGSATFLLQDFYVKEFAENLMMHLLVPDVEAWWRHISAQDLPGRYGVMLQPPEDRDWGIRDFVMNDPTGVLGGSGSRLSRRALRAARLARPSIRRFAALGRNGSVGACRKSIRFMSVANAVDVPGSLPVAPAWGSSAGSSRTGCPAEGPQAMDGLWARPVALVHRAGCPA